MKVRSRAIINAVKCLDRIALVMAIIATVIGSYLGYLWNQDRNKIETSEYKAWRANEYDVMAKRSIRAEAARRGEWRHEFRSLAMIRQPKPERWDYPPAWVSAIRGALVFAPLSFFVAYFATPAAIRLARRVALWVIEVI